MAQKYSFGNGWSRVKLAPPNCPHFQAKIADFGLKYCILNENAKNSVTGSSPSFPRNFRSPARIHLVHLQALSSMLHWNLRIVG